MLGKLGGSFENFKERLQSELLNLKIPLSDFEVFELVESQRWNKLFNEKSKLSFDKRIDSKNFKVEENNLNDLLFFLFPLFNLIKDEKIQLCIHEENHTGLVSVFGKYVTHNIQQILNIDGDSVSIGNNNCSTGLLFDFYEEIDGYNYYEATIWGKWCEEL